MTVHLFTIRNLYPVYNQQLTREDMSKLNLFYDSQLISSHLFNRLAS